MNSVNTKQNTNESILGIDLFIESHPEKFMLFKNKNKLPQLLKDKIAFIKGQIVEVEFFESGTIPGIIINVHPEDENYHNSYDVLFFIGHLDECFNSIISENRYLWRYTKKQNTKRLINYVQSLKRKLYDIKFDIEKSYNITSLHIISNNTISTYNINTNF